MAVNAGHLNRLLHQQLGDWLRVQTTVIPTNTNTHIVSTSLQQWDGGRDDYFTDWWLYVEDGNNAGANRKIRNSYTANSVCNTYGAVFTTDAAQVNVRFHKYSFDEVQRSINDTIREIYPYLFKETEDRTTIVTNSKLLEYTLPNDFQLGEVRQVQINSASESSASQDGWRTVYNWSIVNAGTVIRFPTLPTSGYKVRLLGITPLETVNAFSDQVNIDGPRLDLFIAYAKYKWFQQHGNPVSTLDKRKFDTESAQAYAEFQRLLPRLRMSPPEHTLNLRRS